MLLGEYRLSLDDKGRLSIPAVFRHTIRDVYAPEGQTLIVTKFFENCLRVYPKAVWLDIQQQLQQLRSDPGARAFVRQFCASANVCSLDSQGRILVPQKLRQYAGIDTEALIIGVIDKLEIWSPVRWEAYEAQEGSRFESHTRLMDLRL